MWQDQGKIKGERRERKDEELLEKVPPIKISYTLSFSIISLHHLSPMNLLLFACPFSQSTPIYIYQGTQKLRPGQKFKGENRKERKNREKENRELEYSL